jgi:hypothetical protein
MLNIGKMAPGSELLPARRRPRRRGLLPRPGEAPGGGSAGAWTARPRWKGHRRAPFQRPGRRRRPDRRAARTRRQASIPGLRPHLPRAEVRVAAVGARRHDTATAGPAGARRGRGRRLRLPRTARRPDPARAGGVEQVRGRRAHRRRVSATAPHARCDPLLHTHVLVANLARTSDDGKWRTLDSGAVPARPHRRLRLPGHLRDELTHRLGVAWQPVRQRHGRPPRRRPLLDRRLLQAAGRDPRGTRGARETSSAKAAQVATLATRQAKPDQPDGRPCAAAGATRPTARHPRRRWSSELLHRPARPSCSSVDTAHQLLVPDGLTHRGLDVHPPRRGPCHRRALPDGAPVEHIELMRRPVDRRVWSTGRGRRARCRTATGTLAEVLHPGRRTAPRSPPRPRRQWRRFTTRGAAPPRAGMPPTRPSHARRRVRRGRQAKARPGIATPAHAQRGAGRLVRRLTLRGDGVAVVVGKAGTGKTFALDAAREAWQSVGPAVTGVALAARAALELQDSRRDHLDDAGPAAR